MADWQRRALQTSPFRERLFRTRVRRVGLLRLRMRDEKHEAGRMPQDLMVRKVPCDVNASVEIGQVGMLIGAREVNDWRDSAFN